MLTPEQTDFTTRWQAKANAMPAANLHDHIDKYVTLFINYNFLYNLVPHKLAAANGTRISNVGDKNSATELVIQFLTAQKILAAVPHNLVQQLALSIIHFNIKLKKNGDSEPDYDAQLLKRLQTGNQDQKSLAILEILYYVRCNVVHGRKGLQSYQIMLLEPVVQILSIINPLLFKELDDSVY
jgi:hypothetical protein